MQWYSVLVGIRENWSFFFGAALSFRRLNRLYHDSIGGGMKGRESMDGKDWLRYWHWYALRKERREGRKRVLVNNGRGFARIRNMN